ncbi:MAG: serine/threonine-protein kinase [Gemmataceae bacterium]
MSTTPDPASTLAHVPVDAGQTTEAESFLHAIPGYELISELGRGGMGVVYRARQVLANRDVALKLVLSGDHAGQLELARFRAEGEAIAKLQSPHVVSVFEIGEHAGRPFFSMEYCSGGSLASVPGPHEPRHAATIVFKVAQGVAAAHAAGVVHRDLKPGNILLSASGEPKVADFGLARRIDEGPNEGLTRTGAVVGTPSYMPPEQAAGTRDIGPAVDVYAIGAILYELLTGRPPFRAASPTETLLLVVTEEPVSPRVLRPSVPRDLESIVLKCLEKSPARRYATASELAADLSRYLEGEPVSAARTGVVGRLAGAIDRVQLHERFVGYGTLLLALAPVMLLPEIWNTLALRLGWSGEIVIAGRGVQAVAFLGLVAAFRGRDIWPRGPAERQLWAVWTGYFLACFGYGLSGWAMAGMDADRVCQFYPGFACLTALAFFALAANFWGYCGVVGAGFLALAFAMLIELRLAPLLFGVAWTIVLIILGLRLRRLGRTDTGGTIAGQKTKRESR